MNKLFDIGNKYLKRSDWKDLAMIKLCLCSMGVLIGANVKHKKVASIVASAAFTCTYIPLMSKLYDLLLEEFEVSEFEIEAEPECTFEFVEYEDPGFEVTESGGDITSIEELAAELAEIAGAPDEE